MLKTAIFVLLLATLPWCIPMWIDSRDTKLLLKNRPPPIPAHGKYVTVQHSKKVMEKVASRVEGGGAKAEDFSATADLYYEAHVDEKCNFGKDFGKNMIFLLPMHGASWQFPEMIELFRAQGYCTLIIDTRAHGRSESPPGDMSVELFAEDAVQVIKKVFGEGSKVHTVGWSMGGAMSYYIALEYPDLVLTQTFSGMTSCFGKAIPETGECAPDDLVKLFFTSPPVSKLLGSELQFEAAKSAAKMHDTQGLRNMFFQMVPSRALRAGPALLKWAKQYYHNRLREIKNPVLLLAGELEAEIGMDEASLREDSKRIAGPSEVVILKNMSHALWWETTAEGVSGTALVVDKAMAFHKKHLQ